MISSSSHGPILRFDLVTRGELDLETVPTLVPDNAVNRNSSEVIARF